MSIDMGKLTPAPWEAVCGSWGNGGVYPYVSNIHHDIYKDAETDLAFIVLARAAFDVMMRRGWSPVKATGCRWILIENELNPYIDAGELVTAQDDPFTCLVAADAWLTEREKANA